MLETIKNYYNKSPSRSLRIPISLNQSQSANARQTAIILNGTPCRGLRCVSAAVNRFKNLHSFHNYDTIFQAG